jgi:hypothetical protein
VIAKKKVAQPFFTNLFFSNLWKRQKAKTINGLTEYVLYRLTKPRKNIAKRYLRIGQIQILGNFVGIKLSASLISKHT